MSQDGRIMFLVQRRSTPAAGTRGIPQPEQLVDQAAARIFKNAVEGGTNLLLRDRQTMTKIDIGANPQRGEDLLLALPHRPPAGRRQ
ncbi:hypothetical protein [Protofrankia symbiont of Coriaria ruscifolia]|uniref:hypothetical protein n=1 Tax=Protofrankia symbiont of Coriaria ruscifolia TaxID=1306542 RepID=UPI0013EFA877|nr:hypothetical protein [Protofrankia symbiont of Coriaria ruscifolia]